MPIGLYNKNCMLPEFISSDNCISKQPTILLFDTGVGGLSIYAEVQKVLPNAHYLYVFDNDFFPYGKKTGKFIIDRVVTILGAMRQRHKVDLVIVACNTASTIALSALRSRFPCPIIGVVPAIKPAVRQTRNGIVGLLATDATVQCKYTCELISQCAGSCQILLLGSAELVNVAEAKLYGKAVPIPVLRKVFRPWLSSIEPPDTITLGCTHFPLLRQELQAVLPKGTRLVDSGAAIARRVAWLVEHYININRFQKGETENKAYCLASTARALALMPILMDCGFSSLEKLSP